MSTIQSFPSYYKVKKRKITGYHSSQTCPIPLVNYGNSHAMRHTVLPATRHRWHFRLYN